MRGSEGVQIPSTLQGTAPQQDPKAPRRHPRDLSEAQAAQGLPVLLHSPDTLIVRGARPNPRKGNTALSATPRPSEPSVPTEGASCVSSVFPWTPPRRNPQPLRGPHAELRAYHVADWRAARRPTGLELTAHRGTRPIRIRFGPDKQPIQPIVRLGVGANREDQESLALHGGSCSLKMLDAFRSGALEPRENQSPHLHLFRRFKANILIHQITASP